MPNADRARQLETYLDAHQTLVDALQSFPRAMWRFKPAAEGWSIHEILVHIADSEANGYIRGRRCIAEPGAAVSPYDGMRWSAELRYTEQDPDDALEMFRLMRKRTHALLISLPEDAWQRTFQHPERGPMTLDGWLDLYARHIPEHIDQMRAVHVGWLARQGEE